MVLSGPVAVGRTVGRWPGYGRWLHHEDGAGDIAEQPGVGGIRVIQRLGRVAGPSIPSPSRSVFGRGTKSGSYGGYHFHPIEAPGTGPVGDCMCRLLPRPDQDHPGGRRR